MYRPLLRSLDPRCMYTSPPGPINLTRRAWYCWSLSLSWSVYSSQYFGEKKLPYRIPPAPLSITPAVTGPPLVIATATALIHKQQTALRGNNQHAIVRISQSKCCTIGSSSSSSSRSSTGSMCTMPANNNTNTISSSSSSSRNNTRNKRSNSSLDVNDPPQPATLSGSITTSSSSASQLSIAHANAKVEPVFKPEPEPTQKKTRRSGRIVLLQQKQDLSFISSSGLSPQFCTPIEQLKPVEEERAATGAPPLPSSSQMSSRKARAVTSTTSSPSSSLPTLSSSTIVNLTSSTSRSTRKRQANKAVTATTIVAASSTFTPNAHQPSPITITPPTTTTAPSKSNSTPSLTPPSNSSPSYWLMKSEPESRIEKGKDVKFSIDDLAACKEPAAWDGVRNYAARNNLLAMKKGDLAFFYHSNCKRPGIVGIMEIVEPASIDESAFLPISPYYDPKSTNRDKPKWFIVKVRFIEKFSRLIGLAELKGYSGGGDIAAEKKLLADMQLFKMTRLSVSKVSSEEWRFILGLVGEGSSE